MANAYDPFVLARCLDDEAKWYWSASLLLGVAVFAAGAIGIFFPVASTAMAYLATVLSLAAFLSNQTFENSRSKAQELRRKLDLQDSFGWRVETDEFNDLLLRCSNSVKKKACSQKPDAPYFDSQELHGPKRALQNVRESAWWSEHLSERMFQLSLKVTLVLAAAAVASTIAALATVDTGVVKDLSIYTKLARAVTSLLMLVFSLSLVKLTINYYKFSKGAAKCKEAANGQLKKSPRNKDQALINMYNYFIVRSGSPVLPTWLWKWHRDELNAQYPYKSDNVLVQEAERGSDSTG
jgi:hypothetical protein